MPLWGYQDEAQLAVRARKIDAAADNGLDAFIFDWYWYPQGPGSYGPFLNRCLEDGFLQAPNAGRLKFALMWANQDWWDIFPYHRTDPRYDTTPQSQYYTLIINGARRTGVQPPSSFDQLTSYVWVHHSPFTSFPQMSYATMRTGAMNVWQQFRSELHGPARRPRPHRPA